MRLHRTALPVPSGSLPKVGRGCRRQVRIRGYILICKGSRGGGDFACPTSDTPLRTEASQGGVFEVFGHFVADSTEVVVDFAGSVEGCLDVREDVVCADVLDEIGLLEKLRGLVAGAAEQQRPAGFRQALAKTSSACRPVASMAVMLRRRRITTARKAVEVRGGFGKFLGGAEEEGPVDAQDGDVRRGLACPGERAAWPSRMYSCVTGVDGGGLRDAIDVEERGQRHADFDGDGEIGQNGEGEGDGPDGDVGLARVAGWCRSRATRPCCRRRRTARRRASPAGRSGPAARRRAG